MKKQTLGQEFEALRLRKKMTMTAVAVKAGISESGYWKVERDRPVRWETVHILLTKSFRVKLGSETYDMIHRLWLESRKERADHQPEDFSEKKLSAHAADATKKFRILVRDLDEAEIRYVMAMARRAVGRITSSGPS